MITIRLPRVASALLIAVVAAPCILFQRDSQAADDPPSPTAQPPQPARAISGSPPVFLSRGGPQRTGSVSGSRLPEHPVVLWTTTLSGFPGEPLLADGVIYVGDVDGTLYAIKLADGSILWKFANDQQIYEAPAKRGETIFFTSRKGLTALAQEDGRVLWNSKLVANAVESSPLIVNDRIIVADTDGKVTAVDFGGKLIWQHDIAEDAPPSPPRADGLQAKFAGTAARPRTAASDGTAIFQPIFDQSRIAVIDVKAGRRRWSFETKGWIYVCPTVTEDKVFFGCQDNHLYCLDKRRKTTVWAFPTKSRIETGVAYRDGSVFVGSCDGRFYRINAETGKEVWSYQTPVTNGVSTAIYSAPLCTEDAVYFGSFDGHLYCLKIADGALKWRIEPIKGAEIQGSPMTDGRRIVLSMRRNLEKQGQDAIVVIGEDESKEGAIEKKE
jgi:eukaryotic-like serine/threonine-protein kinase